MSWEAEMQQGWPRPDDKCAVDRGYLPLGDLSLAAGQISCAVPAPWRKSRDETSVAAPRDTGAGWRPTFGHQRSPAGRSIPLKPSLSFKFGRAGGLPSFPFGSPSASFWFSGRAAIFQGVRALGLGAGDLILAPAYACGSEIDALLLTGVDLDFYRIHPDLTPDFNHIERLCCQRHPRALFVTHYSGVPQPIDPLLGIVDRHGLILIEDNAHGLGSVYDDGRPVGSVGDCGIFSLPKHLPLPDGGVLVFGERVASSRRTLAALPRPARPSVRKVAGRLGRLFRSALRDPAPKPIDGHEIAAGSSDPEEAADHGLARIRLPLEAAYWGMSNVSRRLLRLQDLPTIARTRKRNAAAFLTRFVDTPYVRVFNRTLSSGACPSFVGLYCPRATSLKSFLGRLGVHVSIFWPYRHEKVPYDRFPLEIELKQGGLAVPIHQNLASEQVEHVADLIGAWVRAQD